MNEISENTSNAELNKLFLVKIQFAENYFFWMSTHHGAPKFGAKKLRIRIIWVAAWAWITKTTLLGSESLGKSSSAWEYICMANWRRRTVFIKNAMQDVAENLKNWQDAAIKRKQTGKHWRVKHFIQHDQESRTVSLMRDQVRRSQELLVFIEDSKIFDDLDKLRQYVHSSSSSYYFEF